MNNIIKKTICEGIDLTYIPDEKFKTTAISFSMFTPLDEKYVSENAVIPNLLSHSCKKYPSLSEIAMQLEELYGAHIFPGVSKMGDTQVMTIVSETLNDKFISDNHSNIEKTVKLLCEMIFNPDISNEAFNEKHINQEKRQLIEELESEMNDKKIYALRKCQESMCKKEKFGLNPLGKIENAKKITGKKVYDAWKKLLESSHIQITVIGSCPYKLILKTFTDAFSKIQRNNIIHCQNIITEKAHHITEVNEHMKITQCKLVLGLRTQIAKPDEQVEAVKLMNALLGATPQSKLFVNVREKLSLCYYCASKYNSQKGIIFIESGVEKTNILKAKEEIMKQLEEIKLGNFSDKELTETKMFMTQNIEKAKDNIGSLASWYISQTFDEIKHSPGDIIKKMNNITREEIINAAQKITLDTVYILSGMEE